MGAVALVNPCGVSLAIALSFYRHTTAHHLDYVTIQVHRWKHSVAVAFNNQPMKLTN